MKKISMLGLIVVLAASLLLPALANAQDVTTQITVSDSGLAPTVVCKWETPDSADPLHETIGTQVMPNAGTVDLGTGELSIGEVEVCYWAVVTHPSSMDSITGVYADVYHPDVVKQENLNGATDPNGDWCGLFKYQIELALHEDGNNTIAIDTVTAADADGLVFYGTPYTLADVIHMLDQGQAELFQGCELIHNHQPAGFYTVNVNAAAGSSFSENLSNELEVAEMNSFVTDFDLVNYNPVTVELEKQVGGDALMNTPTLPTVWNNGNTYINMTVAQDDAGFGQRSTATGDIWNVHWAARLGSESTGTKISYDPNDAPVTLPELLIMCTPTKMDFFVTVDKAPNGATCYSGTMTLGSDVVSFIDCTPD